MATDCPTDIPAIDDINNYHLGDLKFTALGDRVIIEEDEFRTGYECAQCEGVGNVTCPDCGGTGKRQEGKFRCSTCTDGRVLCDACGGKGGLIVAPETAQRRPTTGKIVSVGDAVKTVKVGQSVMYSNFAGHVIDLTRAGRDVTLRLLHESELLCVIDGHLTLASLKGKTEVATFS